MNKISLELTKVGRASTLTTNFTYALIRNPFRECPNFNKFLAIEEVGERGWWVPGGALEQGDSF